MKSKPKAFEQIFLSRMNDMGCPHPTGLFGLFKGPELIVVKLENGDDTFQWARDRGGSAEQFEDRIIEDIRSYMRGGPVDGMATSW